MSLKKVWTDVIRCCLENPSSREILRNQSLISLVAADGPFPKTHPLLIVHQVLNSRKVGLKKGLKLFFKNW